MDPSTIVVVAAISCGLASCCVVLSLWSFVRLSRVEAHLAQIDTQLPPKRVAQLEQAFDAMVQAFESLQAKNAEFKGAIHNSVNRLDQVMRRNEKAVTQLTDEDGNLQEEAVPGELPASVAAVQPESDANISKQKALQLRWNKNRGIA